MTTKEKVILGLLCVLNFTHMLDFMIMIPLGGHLIPHFHLSPQQFSWLVAAYTVTAGITGVISAFFIDRFDRKKFLLYVFTGFIAGTFLCGIAPSYILLLATRIITGAFGGVIASLVLAIIGDTFSYERRGVAMGIVMSSMSIATIFGVPLALWMANKYSLHAPFIFVGLIGLVTIPFAMKFLPTMNTHINKEARNISIAGTLSNVFKSPSQITALALTGSLMLGHFLIIPFVIPYLEFNVGFNSSQIPLIYLVGGTLTFISSPIIGKLADQFGKMKVFIIFVLVSFAPVFLITNMPSVHYLIVIGIMGSWFMISASRTIPAQTMVSNVVKSNHRGSFMSFNSCVQQLVIGLASIVAGLIITQDESGRISHFNWLGYMSIIIISTSMLLAKRLSRMAIV